MARPKLLWTVMEVYDASADLRQALDQFAQVQARSVPADELHDALRDVDIFVPSLHHTLDAALYDAAPRLRVIATPTTGTDHIDLIEAERRGIAVLTLKHERKLLDSVQATAEHAWLLLLALQRKLPRLQRNVRERRWVDADLRGRELIGHTLGIVGYGRLGTMMSRFAHAFRMNVLAVDPHHTIADPWVRQVELPELLAEADMITLHVHLTDATRSMIGSAQFAQMKRGAVLINTARGELIDEAALLDALRSGHLAGAGLDVVCGERSEDLFEHPLLRYAREHEHVIITPHQAGRTHESQRKVSLHLTAMIRRQWEQAAAVKG